MSATRLPMTARWPRTRRSSSAGSRTTG